MKIIKGLLILAMLILSVESYAQINVTAFSLPELASVKGITEGPNQRLYTITTSNELFYSDDSGDNWLKDERFIQSLIVNDLVYDAQNDGLWIGFQQGLYFLNDDTLTINANLPKEFSLGGNVHDVVLQNDTLYVAHRGLTKYNVFKSGDAGENWIDEGEIPNLGPAGYSQLLIHSSGTLVVRDGRNIARKELGEEGFTQIERPAFESGLSTLLDLDETSDGSVILSTIQGLYISTDTAKTFTLLDDTDYSTSFTELSDGSYLVSNGLRYVRKSTDKGESWTDYSLGLGDGSPFAIKTIFNFLELADGTLLGGLRLTSQGSDLDLGPANGILKSTDAGETWVESSSGLRAATAQSIYTDPESDDVYVFIFFNGVYKTSDYGQNWEKLGNEGTPDLNPVSILDVAVGWEGVLGGASAIGMNPSDGSFWTVNNNYIIRLNPETNDWEPLSQISQAAPTFLTFKNDGSKAYVAERLGPFQGLYIKPDSSDTFTRTDAERPVTIMGMLNIDNIIYAAEFWFTSGGVWKSTDDGATFTALSETPSNDIAYSAQQNKLLSASGASAELIDLTDESITEIEWTGEGFANTFKVSTLSDGSFLSYQQNIFGAEPGIYALNPVLNTWKKVENNKIDGNLVPTMYSTASGVILDYQKSSFILVGGNVDTSTDEEIDSEIASKFILIGNYPNPFNPTTTIEYQVPSASQIAFKVFNSVGQKVYQTNSMVSAGTHSFQFDASSLSSGVYFYQISNGNQILNGKMLLVK